MSKPVLGVVAGVVLAFIAASLLVPVRKGMRIARPLTADEIVRALEQFDADRPPPDAPELDHAIFAELREARRRWCSSELFTDSAGNSPDLVPVRYVWLWGRDTLEEFADWEIEGQAGVVAGEWIQWHRLLPVHGLILLIGGALLSFAVRWERRRKAAAS